MDDRDGTSDRPPTPPPAAASAGKPTPVRVTLGDAGAGEASLRFQGRSVQVGDEEWWAQELGWAATGKREDRGALLLLVGFRPVTRPDGPFEREVLLPAGSLDAISDEALASALAGASPFREIPDEPKPFFGPRGKRRSGGRSPGPRGKGRGRRGS